MSSFGHITIHGSPWASPRRPALHWPQWPPAEARMLRRLRARRNLANGLYAKLRPRLIAQLLAARNQSWASRYLALYSVWRERNWRRRLFRRSGPTRWIGL